jgi:hypothetical protein
MIPERSGNLANLQRLVRRFRGAKRRLYVRRWLVLGTIGYLLSVLLAVHLDRFLHFETVGRWSSFILVHGTAALGAITFVAGLLLAYRRRAALIREMEPLMEGTEESLVTAHDLRGTASSFSPEERQMFALLTSRAESAASVSQPPRPRDPARRWRLAGLAACLLVYGALLATPIYEFPLMLRRFFRPSANLPRPSFTKIAIGDFPARVGVGEDLTIPVRISGRLVDAARLDLRIDGKGPQLLPMTRIGRDRFLHTLFAVRSDLSFRVQAGDGETALHHVRAIQQPSLQRLRVLIQPPDYSRLKGRTVENERRITVLEGCDLTLEIYCSQPLGRAHLKRSTPTGEPETVALKFTDGVATHVLDDVHNQISLRPVLVNDEGFQNLDQEPIVITPEPDEPPTVALPRAPSALKMYPTESRRFEIEAGDDLGLTELTLAFRVNPGGDELSAPARRSLQRYDPPRRETAPDFTLDLETVGVEAGDVVEFAVEATDIRRQVASSRTIRVRVVAYEPGRNERRRIAHLRYLHRLLTLVGDDTTGQRAGAGWPLNQRAQSSLKQYAETLALEGVPSGRDERPDERLIDHLLSELGLTPFHVYRRDLRRLIELVASRGLLTLRTASDRALARRLAREVLPGIIQYRAHRCLYGSLHSFAGEIERIAAEEKDENQQGERIEQIIRSLEGWTVFLARTSRESTFDFASFERFAGDVEEINTLLYRSRTGSPQRLRDLATRLRECADRSNGIEGELYAELENSRTVLSDLCSQADPNDRDIAAILDAADRDPAVSAVEKLALSSSDNGARSGLEKTEFFRAQAALPRIMDFRQHCGSIRNDPLIPDAIAEREIELLSQQHATLLQMQGWPREEPRRLLQHSTDAAEARRIAGTLPPLRRDARRQVLRALLEAYAALRNQHAEFTKQVSQFVPEDTLRQRKGLLERVNAFEDASRRTMRQIRLWLTNLPLAEDRASETTARGWARVLVRLEDRLDFFRSSARRTLDHLRRNAGQRLSRDDLSLLPARMTALGGAIRGLGNFFDELRPVLKNREEGAVLPEDFFSRQSERLSAARQLDTNLSRYFALRKAATASALTGEARSILSTDARLRGRILSRFLKPRVADINAAAENLWDTMDGDEVAPETILEASKQVLNAAERARSDLQRVGSGGLARHVETIEAPLTEIIELLTGAGNGRPPKRRLQLLDYNRQRLRSLIDALQGQLEEVEAAFRASHRGAQSYEERAARATHERLAERVIDFQQLALLTALRADDGPEPDEVAPRAWFCSVNYAASATLLRKGVSLLVGAGGRRVKSKKHWLVSEFRENLKKPLPMRHRTQVKRYFRNLQSAFREHEHTR